MKELKWYSIMKSSNSLFTEDTLIQAKNSKEALQKIINKKVVRVNSYYAPFDYSVMTSNEKGHFYRDKRKTIYYNVIK